MQVLEVPLKPHHRKAEGSPCSCPRNPSGTAIASQAPTPNEGVKVSSGVPHNPGAAVALLPRRSRSSMWCSARLPETVPEMISCPNESMDMLDT